MMITEAHFNRATLDCMTALRRRIKQDIGINIRLTAPDAAEELIKWSGTSHIPEVRALGQQLADILAPAATEQAAQPAIGAIASRRLGAQNHRQPTPESGSDAPSTSVRIYRGQIVR